MNTAPKPLRVELLGNFRLIYGEQPVVSVKTVRMRSLLAYLLLNRHASLSRQHIAFLFWPDSTEIQARTNLRQLLHHLHRAFPELEHFLQTDTKTLQWREDAPYNFDVAEFQHALAQVTQTDGQDDPSSLRTALETAASIYRGDLLPECYEEWIEAERAQMRQQFVTVLERLVRVLEKQREYEKAIGYAGRLLKMDDLQESTYVTLMRLYALNDDRSNALRIYHSCTKVLKHEFGIEPGPEIRQLYQRLMEMPARAKPEDRVSSTRHMERLPLVGRQKEWEMLQDAWNTIGEKHPHMIWIMGEAGIGKTRLAEELFEWVNRQGGTTAHTRFYAAEGSLAYAPVSDWLRSDHFRSALSILDDIWLKEIVRILPELRTERPDIEIPEPLTETWQRQRFFEALARAILVAPQPLLLLIDDLQWCNQETLEWLHYLLRFDEQAQVLIICTVRTELLNENKSLMSFMLDLHHGSYLSQIELTPLDAEESALLASQVSDKKLTEDWVKQLYQETEGNPLFVVEMTRAGLEKVQSTVEPYLPKETVSPLPPKMQAVIQYRLLQLTTEAQKLVELAAIIGRDFSFKVLEQACEQDEDSIIQVLDELLLRRIIREQGATDYDFSHDKIREVAYQAISEGRRRLLHRRVAQAMETIHAPDLDAVSARLAVHYEKARVPEKASDYYELAGKVSQRIYANIEAIDFLQRGLGLVSGLPENETRSRKELSLLLALAPSLVQAKGYGAKEVHHACDRVHSLCQKSGESTHPPVLRTLAIGKLVTGEIVAAEDLGKNILKQSQQTGDEVVQVEAHYVLGVTYHWQGNFSKARRHLEQALELYNPQNHRTHITHYGQDPGVICGIRLALVLWKLGYPYQAKIQAEKALSLSEEFNHPFSRAYALHWCAWLHNLRGDVETTLVHAGVSMEFSRKYQFPYFATQSVILHGWAMFEQDDDIRGLEQMRSGLAHFRATGSLVGIPYYRGLLALDLARLGRGEQALTVIDEALAVLEARQEHWQESELYRLKGNILLLNDETDIHHLAEQSFRRAIEIACSQKAKTFALHAVCTLSQLLESQNRKEESQQLFEETYRWFRKGLNAADLQEAEALVKEWI